jgi:NADPH-dependent curcumin reductase CurA
MSTTAQIFHLKQTPQGLPNAADFELRDIQLPEPGDNQVLVENLYMSVDPYMRGRMRFMPPGSKLFGAAVGRVLASNSPTISFSIRIAGTVTLSTTRVLSPNSTPNSPRYPVI